MEQRDFEIVENGSWRDIRKFCSRLSDVLEEDVDEEVHKRFENWRPKPEDSKHDLRTKTAQEEAIHETQLEKKSEGVTQEMKKAGQGVRQGGKDIVDGRPQESIRDVEDAGSSAARSLFPPFLRLFRALEEALYANVIGKTSPNYFECDDFTVALERGILDRKNYRVRIVFEDRTLMDTVSSEL